MVWDGWESVPPFIKRRVENKNAGDWIVYVPRVIRNRGKMAPTKFASIPNWIKALEQKNKGTPIRCAEFEHGFVFIGEDVCPILIENKEGNTE